MKKVLFKFTHWKTKIYWNCDNTYDSHINAIVQNWTFKNEYKKVQFVKEKYLAFKDTVFQMCSVESGFVWTVILIFEKKNDFLNIEQTNTIIYTEFFPLYAVNLSFNLQLMTAYNEKYKTHFCNLLYLT